MIESTTDNQAQWPPLCTPLHQSSLWVPKKLYGWQRDVIAAFQQQHSRVSIATCNESGKTSVVAPVCLLSAMCAFPGARVLATSGSERQVKEQLFEDTLVKIVEPLTKYGWTIQRGELKITAPNGSTLLCYVCKKAENVEGFHGKWVIGADGKPRYEPCIYLIDEAKSVSDDIHDAIRRIDPDFMIAMSSPGPMGGWFYRSIDPDRLPDREKNDDKHFDIEDEFLKPSAKYSFPGEYWTYRRMINMYDCPHLMTPIKRRERENIAEKRGRNSPFVRSMLYGEFQASEEGNSIYSDDMVALAKESMRGFSNPVPGDVRAAGDVSGGGDKQVLMVRSGTEVLMIHKEPYATEIELAEQWVNILRELDIEPYQFWIDGGGIGAPVANYMEMRLGYSGINRFMSNNSADVDHEYKDRYTELHWWIRELLYHKVLKLPHDDDLIEHMRKRRYVETDDSKIKTEPKKSHREREKNSPDELDTLVYLFADFPMGSFRRGIIEKALSADKAVSVGNKRSPLLAAVQRDNSTILSGLPKQPAFFSRNYLIDVARIMSH